jgi:asparagine synthase (glutamine-hydrolysing)
MTMTAAQQMYVQLPAFEYVSKVFTRAVAEEEKQWQGGEAIKPEELEHGIRFEDVCVSHGEKAALQNISVFLPPCSVVALVGPSGAGKTTFVDVLLRLVEADSGRIMVGRRNVGEFNVQAWRSCIGYVSQELTLVNGSLADNIKLFKPDATQQEVCRAAVLAHAHEFIERLPEGYHTQVGEMGLKLSGGQRQRIAVARALINDPPVLIFDDATSALDSESEERVMEAVYDTLLFASELKAIRAYPGFQPEVDRDVLAQFLRHNVIPAPQSIYRGIFKLPPGTLLKVKQENVLKATLGAPRPYWSLLETAFTGQGNLFKGSAVEACDELDRLLKQSISGQMLADVPLGAFLSGGVDSSTVVALMQAQSTRPVRTFTIGFHEGGYDEALQARAVAAHLGTEHTELYVTPEQALAVIPRLSKLYDEPFADVSQIPTFMVSELAQRNVTVCLSGDGGDELFGGYNRYTAGARLWRQLGWLPKTVRAGLAAGISAARPSAWDACFDRFGSIVPRGWRVRTPGIKMQKIAEMLAASSPEDVYLRLTSQWSNPEQAVIGSTLPSEKQPLPMSSPPTLAHEHQMMIMDSLGYLPDDILVKVDRAAMGVSLETRVPMLDHRVVEFAWRLPLEMKIHGNEGKWLLRQVLDRYVPRSLIERPKTGFSVPIGTWLHGPLKEWAEDLINPDKLRNQGFFVHEQVQTKWIEHQDEKRDWSSQLWGVLMFQAWLDDQ